MLGNMPIGRDETLSSAGYLKDRLSWNSMEWKGSRDPLSLFNTKCFVKCAICCCAELSHQFCGFSTDSNCFEERGECMNWSSAAIFQDGWRQPICYPFVKVTVSTHFDSRRFTEFLFSYQLFGTIFQDARHIMEIVYCGRFLRRRCVSSSLAVPFGSCRAQISLILPFFKDDVDEVRRLTQAVICKRANSKTTDVRNSIAEFRRFHFYL